MESVVQPTIEFISAHSSWAFPVMFVTAFGESFAFLSLLFPGTSILIFAGTLMSAGSGGSGHRGGARRLGLVLAWSPLWRRDRPDMAVHAQSGPAAERHPVFSETRRQKRFYRPLFWPGAGCNTARGGHHANAPRPVLVRQRHLGDRLGTDAAVRRRCRWRRRRPPDRLRQYSIARLCPSDRVRHHRGGVGNDEVRQIEIVREDEWPRSFHLTATNSSASEPAFRMSQSQIRGRTPTMSWISSLRAIRPASP